MEKYGLAWIATVAEVCHEVNKAYCEAIGDTTQVPWGEAPQWQRESAIKGVEMHLATLDRGEEPRPSDSHEGWLAEKLAAGWQYGPVKDPEKKEHPCMVPFCALPKEQQIKDHLFIAVCRAARAQYNR